MNAEALRIWGLYESAKSKNTYNSIFSDFEKCHDFYLGNQWRGIESGGEELPVLNFIKPVGKYKISMIAQNHLGIVYSAVDGDSRANAVCEHLNKLAESQWEKSKLDTMGWRLIRESFISGDSYCYCYAENGENSFGGLPKINMREVYKNDIYFADEENPNINDQEWIIITEHPPVEAVKHMALKNGVSAEDAAGILPDNESEDEKCTSILYMRLCEKGLEFCRLVRGLIYVKPQIINGLNAYPIAVMRWESAPNSMRGQSGVKPMIANQLEVNKTAARRVVAVKRYSYPTLAYSSGKVQNIDELSKIGASIAVDNMAETPISALIQYLNPIPISSDAQILQTELMRVTRELEGAGEATTGQIDPTRASGEAIKAARDQSAVSLNEQMAAYSQFVEDIAVIWYKLWTAYAAGGIRIKKGDKSEYISKDELRRLDITIKIDVSPIDPYSRLSQETALERLMSGGYITFEEYADAIDDSSSVPKAKLKAIIEARKAGEMLEVR